MSTENPPKPAAAVILIRPAESGGFEIFLVRRPKEAAFFGGVYCFPGGCVRPEDSLPSMVMRCRGLSQDVARRTIGAHLKAREALGYWIAAIRELFEQTGVLLASAEANESFSAEPDCNARPNEKPGVNFLRLLKSKGLFCDAGRLLSFSHWLIPASCGTPFATRLFLAALPERQQPVARLEVEDALWLTADRALQLFHHCQLPMGFPTFAALRTLADFDTLESVLREFATRAGKD